MTEVTGLLLVAGVIVGILLAVSLVVIAFLIFERTRTKDKVKDMMAAFYQTANKEVIQQLVTGLAAIEAKQAIAEMDHGKLTKELYTRIDELKADLVTANEKLATALELISQLNAQVTMLTNALAKSEAE